MLRLGGPAIHPSILTPLLVMALAFLLLFVTLHLAAMRNEILRRRVRTMRMMQASAGMSDARAARAVHRRRLRGAPSLIVGADRLGRSPTTARSGARSPSSKRAASTRRSQRRDRPHETARRRHERERQTPDTSADARRRKLIVSCRSRCSSASRRCSSVRLGAGDPSRLPSALIGKPVPQTPLPPLAGLDARRQAGAGHRPRRLRGRGDGGQCLGVVVRARATTRRRCCCKLAGDKRIRVVGINQKDQPDNARRFLGRYGNPFAAIGVDANGRASIEWGVYGVPETFVVGRDGRIAFKLVGADHAGEFRAPAQAGARGRQRQALKTR